MRQVPHALLTRPPLASAGLHPEGIRPTRLVRLACVKHAATFEPLYLQAAKRSEDGTMNVIRLSEQDGKRGSIKLDKPVKLLNMLEEVISETNTITYTPFEIITIGVDL